MRVRGRRECRDCGTRWSYFETGELSCPACGGLHSVGRDDPREHTDLAPDLSLDAVRASLAEAPLERTAWRARRTAGEYLRRRGFIRGGALAPLDDTFLAAAELRHVAGHLERDRTPDERVEAYFLDLLETVDRDERLPATAVPRPLRSARGLAVVDAVERYTRETRRFRPGRDLGPTERTVLDRLEAQTTRLGHLDGDVPPERAEILVVATRELSRAIRGNGEEDLARALERLDGLPFE